MSEKTVMSKQNEPVNQHYIPRFYLRGWQIGGGDKHVYSYMIANKTVVHKPRSPKHICSIDHLYTLFPETPFADQNSYAIEDFFSRIEHKASAVLKCILESGVRGLSIEKKQIFSSFILSLEYRHPTSVNVLHQNAVERSQQTKERLLQPSGHYSPEVEKQRLNNMEKTSALFDVDVRARNMVLCRIKELIEDDSLIRNISNMCWSTVEYKDDSDGFFVSSDKPLIVNCGSGFQDENTLITLPLSPKKLLIIFDNKADDDEFLSTVAATHNFMLMERSGFIISNRAIENTSYLKNKTALESIFKNKAQ